MELRKEVRMRDNPVVNFHGLHFVELNSNNSGVGNQQHSGTARENQGPPLVTCDTSSCLQ